MMVSIISFQFEVLTFFDNDGHQLPVRSSVNNANAFIAAPYGIYKTNDGYIALAMGNIVVLGELLKCETLKQYSNSGDWFVKRDEIKKILAAHLLTNGATHWLDILEKADIWCAPVLDYDMLMKTEGYRVLNMEIIAKTSNGLSVKTTRCPIRVDGKMLLSDVGAPMLGEHNEEIDTRMRSTKETELNN
jgi:crotonobetainyl-CoA:carnitine CoA-transferase CaiB-like acyl-CoA transferase